jgi:hypothetical protein
VSEKSIIDDFRNNGYVIDIDIELSREVHHELVSSHLSHSSILIDNLVFVTKVLVVSKFLLVVVATLTSMVIVSFLLKILVPVILVLVAPLSVVVTSFRVVVLSLGSSALVVVVVVVVSSFHLRMQSYVFKVD